MKEKTEAAKAMHRKRNGRWGVGLLLYNEGDLGCGHPVEIAESRSNHRLQTRSQKYLTADREVQG
jgi:hypothetical protein